MVEQVDEALDGRCVGRVVHVGRGETVEGDRIGRTHLHGFGVGGVVACAATDVGVFADGERSEELLACRASHRSAHCRHDHVRHAQTVERALVGHPVLVVADLEALVVDVEAVGVLHRELAAAQQPGSGAGLVAELVLDLVDHEGQVLVAGVQVLHQEREHLLVGGRQHEVGAFAVLHPEDVVAVLRPSAAQLERLAGEQGREVDLLEPLAVHLFAHDPLDVSKHDPAERQPGEPARGGTADVAGAHEQAMARHLGIGRVLAEGAEEQGRQAEHGLGGYRPRSRESPAILGASLSSWNRRRGPSGPRLLL